MAQPAACFALPPPGLRVERTEVRPPAPGSSAPATAVGTGVTDDIPCQLVLKSIGYKGLPLQVGAIRRGGGGSRRGSLQECIGRGLLTHFRADVR